MLAAVSLLVADVLHASLDFQLTVVVLEMDTEEELEDDEAEVDPEGPCPRKRVLCRLRAVNPDEEHGRRGACNRQVQYVDVAQGETQPQALTPVLVKDTDATYYSICVHQDRDQSAPEELK